MAEQNFNIIYIVLTLAFSGACWIQYRYFRKRLKRAEEARDEVESILENVQDIYYRTDRNGIVVKVAPSVQKILGFDVKTATGMDLASLYVEPGGREEFLKTLMKNGGIVENYELRMKKADGSILWASANSHAIYDAQGNFAGVEGLTRDITRRKQAEESLRESEELFRVITENAVMGVVLYDVDGLIIYTNPITESITGYSREELCRLHIWDFLTEEQRDSVYDTLKRRLDGDRAPTLYRELQIICRGGEHRWIHAVSTGVIFKGEFAGMVNFLDITAMRRMERLRDDVERMVHHDLKAPLNVILGNAELLQEDLPPGEQRDSAKAIIDNTKKLVYRINNSLDFYRMEEGSYVPRFAPVDLCELFRSMEKESYDLCRRSSLKIRIFIHGHEISDGDRCQIDGEAIHLETLFTNLLKNALEASSPGGEVTIHLERDEPASLCRISIHNDGVVPEPIRRRLFERYVTWGKKRGTGLGAYSASLIARTHGGSIDFTTDEVSGTIFRVNLPLRRKPPSLSVPAG